MENFQRSELINLIHRLSYSVCVKILQLKNGYNPLHVLLFVRGIRNSILILRHYETEFSRIRDIRDVDVSNIPIDNNILQCFEHLCEFIDVYNNPDDPMSQIDTTNWLEISNNTDNNSNNRINTESSQPTNNSSDRNNLIVDDWFYREENIHLQWKHFIDLSYSPVFRNDYPHLLPIIASSESIFIEIYVAVSKNAIGETLTDVLNATGNNGKEIKLFFNYRTNKPSLIEDKILKTSCKIFEARKPLNNPRSSLMERYILIAELILTYVALTANNYSIQGKRVVTLYNFKSRALMSTVLQQLLPGIATKIKKHLQDIFEKKISVLCSNCGPLCSYRYEPWHISTDIFTNASLHTLNIETSFMKNHYPYTVQHNQLSRFNQTIQIHRQETIHGNCYTASCLIDKLSEVVNSTQDNQKYCSYLLLIVNGFNQNTDMTQPTAELLKDECLQYYYYAGHTKGISYRKDHFSNSTSSKLKNALLPNSKIYFLRKCVSSNILEILFDEAVIIEYLRAIRTHKIHQLSENNFFILNKSSMTFAMLDTNLHHLDIIGDFVDKNVSLIDPLIDVVTESQAGTFSGNYGMEDITKSCNLPKQVNDTVKNEVTLIQDVNKLIRCRKYNPFIVSHYQSTTENEEN